MFDSSTGKTIRVGIFNWIGQFSSNTETDPDRIWLTKRAKLDGIARETNRQLADGNRTAPDLVVLVAHFPSTAGELERTVNDQIVLDRSVIVARADRLTTKMADELTLDEIRRVEFIVGERHPLPSHDQAIAEFARSLPCRCHLTNHLAFDDAVMRVAFVGGQLETMLKQLGMTENEAIASPMLSRTIQRRLKTFERNHPGDTPAGSAEEWFERNHPDLLHG